MKYPYYPDPFVDKSVTYVISKLAAKVIELPIIFTIEDTVQETSTNDEFTHYLSCYTWIDRKNAKPTPLNFPDNEDRSDNYAKLIIHVLNDDATFKIYKRLKASLSREYGKFIVHE